MCGLLYDTIALGEKRKSEVIDQMKFSFEINFFLLLIVSFCESQTCQISPIKTPEEVWLAVLSYS